MIARHWQLAALGLSSSILLNLGARPAEGAQFTSPAASYSLTYPDSWNAEADGRAAVLRNFPEEQTPEGGFVPVGGAVVIVQVFPPYDHPNFPQGRDDYSALDYMARNFKVVARTSPSSGQPARVTHIVESANLRVVRTVRHVGGRVFLLSLECLADDPQAAAYEEVLESVAASTAVVRTTPAPLAP